MITCSECGYGNYIETGYCIVCGSQLLSDKSIKKNRLLFFLTPFFIISIFTALLAELGSIEPIATGISVGGDLALIYLVVGACFWLTMRIFKLKRALSDSWLAGVFTVIQLIICSLLVYLAFDNSNTLEPTDMVRLKYLATLFLPSISIGLLSILIRKKFITNQNLTLFSTLLNNSLLIIVVITLLAATVLFYTKSATDKVYLKAKLMSDLGADKRAIKMLNYALKDFSNSAKIYFLKGNILLRDSSLDNSSALSCFKKAFQINSGNPKYLLRLSLAFDLIGNQFEAIKCAKRATETIASSSSEAWKFLGNLQTKYYKNDKAIISFKKALQLNPNDPLIMNNLSFTLLESNKELPLALELAKQSVKRLSGYLFNLDTLAWAYYKNKNLNKALEVMNIIHYQKQELSSEIEFHYAMILYKLNLLKKPDEALNKLMQNTDVLTNHLLKTQISDELQKIRIKLQKQKYE